MMMDYCIHINNKVIIFLWFLFIISCTSERNGGTLVKNLSTIEATTDLVIGIPDQPLEYQLGRPIAVRTDAEGHIYIADRASREIKVFDHDGTYLRSIGGRGRGPGEFEDFEFMEMSPEGHLVLMDRGNMRYTVISREGEEVGSYPYNMSDPFYPQSITYTDEQILALFYNSSSRLEIPEFERDLFHLYSTDFQQRKTSFMPVEQLGYDNWYLVNAMGIHPGSFTLSEDDTILIFSPCTYTGLLYKFMKENDGLWTFDRTIQGTTPGIDPYQIYASESQFLSAMDSEIARAGQVSDANGTHWGSQFSMDAGIYSLKDGRMVHFYAEWKEDYKRLPGSMSHPMDLYVQVFDPSGELTHHSFLFTYIEQFVVPFFSVVNWMDENGNFYMLDHPDEIPIVRRFSLDLPGVGKSEK